ncbi:MAG: sulfurtransferase TusA family protein [Anaerolineae bacterium]|nr:sulfurtransferase TusA family protein [Anaerolineae bacterium]
MKTIDVCGLSCPEPVIRVREALKTLDEGEQLEVLVETVTSRENIHRMAESKGWTVSIVETEGGFRLTIGK